MVLLQKRRRGHEPLPLNELSPRSSHRYCVSPLAYNKRLLEVNRNAVNVPSVSDQIDCINAES